MASFLSPWMHRYVKVMKHDPESASESDNDSENVNTSSNNDDKSKPQAQESRHSPRTRKLVVFLMVLSAGIFLGIFFNRKDRWSASSTYFNSHNSGSGGGGILGNFGFGGSPSSSSPPPAALDSVAELSWQQSLQRFDWKALRYDNSTTPSAKPKGYLEYPTSAYLSNNQSALLAMEEQAVVQDGRRTNQRLQALGQRLLAASPRCQTPTTNNITNSTSTAPSTSSIVQTQNFTALILGGSISRNPQGYAAHLTRFFESAFHPTIDVQVVNAAIGATGGDIPSYCLHHILDKNHLQERGGVDIIITEFSMNPTTIEDATRLYRRIESLQIGRKPAHVVLDLFVYNRDPRILCPHGANITNPSPSVAQALTADDDITVISAACALAQVWGEAEHEQDGPFRRDTMFASDNWHPNKEHHAWVGYVLMQYFTKVFVQGFHGNGTTTTQKGGIGTTRVDVDQACTTAKQAFFQTTLQATTTTTTPHPQPSEGLCLTNWTYHTSFTYTSTSGFIPNSDLKDPSKHWYQTTTTDESTIGSWIRFVLPPMDQDCESIAVGYMKSGKYQLGSVDVEVDGKNVGGIVVDTSVPYSIQDTKPFYGEKEEEEDGVVVVPLLKAGVEHEVKIVVTNETFGGDGSGYGFIVTGLYC